MTKPPAKSRSRKLLSKVKKSQEELAKYVDRYLKQQITSALESDPRYQRLQNQQEALKGKLWEDRLNAGRKDKAAERLIEQAKAKRAEAQSCRTRIKGNEQQLEAVEADMAKLVDVKRDEMRDAEMKRIQSELISS